jgi:hypothetical protein
VILPLLPIDPEEFKLQHLICRGGDGGEGGDGGGGAGGDDGGDFVGDGQGDFGNTGDFFGDNTSNGEFFGPSSDPSDPSNAANIAENAGSPFATGDPFDTGTAGVFGSVGDYAGGPFSGGLDTGPLGGGFGWTDSVGEEPGYFGDLNSYSPSLAGSYAYDDNFGPTSGVYGTDFGFGYNGGPFSAGFNTYAAGPDNSYFGGGPGSMGYGGFGLNSLAGSVTGFNGAIGGRGGIGDLGLQGPAAAPAGLLGFLGISPARGAELYDPEAQAPEYGRGFTHDPNTMPSKDPAPWTNLTPQEVPEEPTTITLQQELPSKEATAVTPTEVQSPAPAPTATVPAAPSAQSYANPGSAAPGTSQGSVMETPGTSQSGWASGIQASIAPSNPGLANAIGPYASAEQVWPGAQGSPATAGAAAGVFEGAPAARGAGTQGVPSAPNNNAPANDLSREAFNNMFRGTPMADHYDTVVREAARVGISPALQAGIIAFETGRGRSNAISRYNNPAGLNPATRGNRGFFSFPTLGAGIARSADIIARNLSRGRGTIQGLGRIYAPPGAANDPGRTNASWPANVSRFMAQLGGNPSTVTVPRGAAAPTSVATRGQPQARGSWQFAGLTGNINVGALPGIAGPATVPAMGAMQEDLARNVQRDATPDQVVEDALDKAADRGVPPSQAAIMAAIQSLTTQIEQGKSLTQSVQETVNALLDKGINNARDIVTNIVSNLQQQQQTPDVKGIQTPGIANFLHGMTSPFAQLFTLPPGPPQDIAREAPFFGDVAAGKGNPAFSTEVAAGKGVHDISIETAAGKGNLDNIAIAPAPVSQAPDLSDLDAVATPDLSSQLGLDNINVNDFGPSQAVTESPGPTETAFDVGPSTAQHDVGPQQTLSPVDDMTPLAPVEIPMQQLDPAGPIEQSPAAPAPAPSPASNPAISHAPPASQLTTTKQWRCFRWQICQSSRFRHLQAQASRHGAYLHSCKKAGRPSASWT